MGRTVEPVILRVALYPFVPDRVALFEKLESRFECDHPGVNVVLVSSPNATDDYYADDKSAHKGFQYVSADVYEIDTILLAEFIALGKIAPISLPYDDFPPEAIKAVSRDGKVFGVPHWLCGNFLFYRAGDVEVANARSWGDLSRILTSRNQDLLVDFKGRSTLGEWYFTVLSAIVGLDTAQQQIVDDSPVNMDAVGYLQNILEECPEGYCRSDALHNNTGFYARAFIHGKAAVYAGYSETISYGLREGFDNCLATSNCLSEKQIAVRSLPLFSPAENKGSGVGWVDALALDAKLSDVKKNLALEFVKLATSETAYQSMLQPEWPYKSRYLLPARQSIRIKDAPLYAQFLPAQSGRGTGTLLHLNAKLREIAGKVTCALPIDRDDIATKNACKN